MILFRVIKKKEEAIMLLQKNFHLYDPFNNNKQKATSNKVPPEIFSFL